MAPARDFQVRGTAANSSSPNSLRRTEMDPVASALSTMKDSVSWWWRTSWRANWYSRIARIGRRPGGIQRPSIKIFMTIPASR